MKLPIVLLSLLMMWIIPVQAEVTQTQEIIIEIDESAEANNAKEIHLNLAVNGEEAELTFTPEMLETQTGRDALMADLPPSLQAVLGRELGRLAAEMSQLDLDISVEVDSEQTEVHELVWIEEGADDNVFEHKVVMIGDADKGSETDLIVSLIERATLSEAQINQILAAVEAKLE